MELPVRLQSFSFVSPAQLWSDRQHNCPSVGICQVPGRPATQCHVCTVAPVQLALETSWELQCHASVSRPAGGGRGAALLIVRPVLPGVCHAAVASNAWCLMTHCFLGGRRDASRFADCLHLQICSDINVKTLHSTESNAQPPAEQCPPDIQHEGERHLSPDLMFAHASCLASCTAPASCTARARCCGHPCTCMTCCQNAPCCRPC